MLKTSLLIFLFLIISSVCYAFPDPAIVNLNISQGEDYQQSWQLKACAAYNAFGLCTSSVPANLTGYSFAAMGKTSAISQVPLFTFDTASDSTGIVTLTLPASVTMINGNRSGYWDLQMTAPSGGISYIMKGKFNIIPTVTH